MSVIDFVNTNIGTLNEYRYSHGNIYPITARPFGMVHFTLQSNGKLGSRFYNPNSCSIEGFRLTHQASPWVGDYGQMLFIPFSGKLMENPFCRSSSFRRGEAVIRPDKIEMYLQRYRMQTKLTTTVRGAMLTVQNEDFSRGQTGFLMCPYSKSSLSVKGNAVTGWTDYEGYWNFKNLREYFYVEFSKTPVKTQAIEADGVALFFDDAELEIKIATSFISQEQAKRNFEQELQGKTYAEIEKDATAAWENYLEKIEVSNENPERTKTFYSCLYRALLYPRVFHEYGEDGAPVHFNADTGKTEKGVFYTDNGFWDTYRTVYPFLTIFDPKLVREMIEGFVNYSEETGWLPKWIAPAEMGLMPGTLVEAVLADACVKGIIDEDLTKRAYRAMLKNAYEKCENGRFGRLGIEEYIRYGYVTNALNENINHTCDSAYGDFCISEVAKCVGDYEQAEKLAARSKNYRNLFDEETKFLRGKDANGNFTTPFDPYEWCGDNCEGGSWQNSFSAYHDIEGLAALHGGKDKLEEKLDDLFATPPIFHTERIGLEIHEMSEMACADFGQCAISNQPSFHIPWLYSAIGKREKTEYWVERLVAEAFGSGIDGFPGDEDNGSMACWYIFACFGFYPLCPGKAEYVTAKPLFEKIKVNGKEFAEWKSSVVSHKDLFKD